MTMPSERKNAVLRTEEFLIAILRGEYAHHYEDLLLEARCCLKHYPSKYYMDMAEEHTPGVFGDYK